MLNKQAPAIGVAMILLLGTQAMATPIDDARPMVSGMVRNVEEWSQGACSPQQILDAAG